MLQITHFREIFGKYVQRGSFLNSHFKSIYKMNEFYNIHNSQNYFNYFSGFLYSSTNINWDITKPKEINQSKF